MLVDIGNVGVQNSTFWKFTMAAVAVLENAQQSISWPILDKFAPNLCADKYGEYKGHKQPIIALFVNSRWRQHFLEFKMGWPPS